MSVEADCEGKVVATVVGVGEEERECTKEIEELEFWFPGKLPAEPPFFGAW